MTGGDILNHAGTISHKQATQKAALEYERYKERANNELSTVEEHFLASIESTVKQLKKKKDH